MSREEFADAINAAISELHLGRNRKNPGHLYVNSRWVGAMERGERRWTGEERRAAMRAVTGASSDEELGLYPQRDRLVGHNNSGRLDAVVRRDGSFAGPATEFVLRAGRAVITADASMVVPSSSAAVWSPDGGEGPPGRQIADIAASLGLFGLSPERARRQVGIGDVARIEAITVLFRSVDYECGGGALYDDVGQFAEAASALHVHATVDRSGGRLASAVASARQLAGWTAFDAGRHSDASRHWLAAERAAHAAEDAQLTARIRYCQARQFQHEKHNHDALETLRLARAHLTGRETPALLALLLGAEAASLAALGDHQGAINALASATEWFESIKPEHEPEWMSFYDRGELLAQYGRVHRDFARFDPNNAGAAVEWTQAAIEAFGPQNVRSTVLNQVGLCSALVLAGAYDDAVSVGTAVLNHGRELNSRRVQDRIRNLARDIPPDPRHGTLAVLRQTVLDPRIEVL